VSTKRRSTATRVIKTYRIMNLYAHIGDAVLVSGEHSIVAVLADRRCPFSCAPISGHRARSIAPREKSL
jgi:hypothetical protein